MTETTAQIRLYLYLRSVSMTPEKMSEELGVPFDRCHRIGEPRGKTLTNQQFWEEHWWIIQEKTDSTYSDAYNDLPIVLDRLLTRVEQRWEALADFDLYCEPECKRVHAD